MSKSKLIVAALAWATACGAQRAAAATHSVLFCQTEAGYTQMMNQVNTAVAAGNYTSAQLQAIIEANACMRDVWHPGQPKYHIVDSDGDFVIITDGPNTGYMIRRDYDQMYVVGN